MDPQKETVKSPAHRMMKNNLILALALAVLSTFALWYEFKQKPKSEKKEEIAKRVVPILEDKEVDTIRLVNVPAGGDITLQCKAGCKASDSSGEWAITAPGTFMADNVASSAAANAVATMVPVDKVDVTGADDADLVGG